MHDSQNGGGVAIGGAGVGWNDSNQLTGGSLSGPRNQLLVTSCVGCHTSTGTSTIINLGSSKIPIVYNTSGYPSGALAGGNFYWTSQGSSYDAYGHNVYGIANTDSNLSIAPGRQSGTCGSGSGSCHVTLATPPSSNNLNKGGCQGCHVYTAHHDDSKPWYRFLKGHNSDDDYVTGVEDSNWEQNPGAGHNKYKGYAGPIENNGDAFEFTHTISGFCGGCHGRFHKEAYIGSSSPWIRHPTDISLPNYGEYSGYDPSTSYSTEAPVAWLNPSLANPPRADAVVMCLSCHRPHGSPYPDILRWDYATMIAGGTSTDTGCFTCHTTKNVAP